jgi:hypothetical protein
MANIAIACVGDCRRVELSRLRDDIKSHALHTLVVLLFLIYPSLLSTMLGVLNCREIHNNFYIASDLSVSCYTPTHRAYQVSYPLRLSIMLNVLNCREFRIRFCVAASDPSALF